MSVLDEVLCTGHGVGDVVPVLHYLEERSERTLSLGLTNVVHPIRITCMRCIFFQVKSGVISRGVIVRRLMIIMPLSPR